jgi:multiple sugar transport system substrate-binding protein
MQKAWILERFNPATLRTCQVAGDDRYFLVPWFSETRLIYTNKKYMDSVQASPEALLSYSGFMEYLQSIKAADLQVGEELVDPYGLPGLNDWNVLHNFAPWVWSFGGSFIIEENGQWRSGLLEPATVKGIFSYMHIVLSDLHAPEAIKENTSIVEMQFGTGQFAVFANTTNLIRNMELDSLSGGYSDRILAQDGLYATPFPSGPEGSVPFLGGSNLTIPATHRDNALALELIKTLTTTEQIDHYSRSVGFVPPDTTNWDLWDLSPSTMRRLPASATPGPTPTFPSGARWKGSWSAHLQRFGPCWIPSSIHQPITIESLMITTSR